MLTTLLPVHSLGDEFVDLEGVIAFTLPLTFDLQDVGEGIDCTPEVGLPGLGVGTGCVRNRIVLF